MSGRMGTGSETFTVPEGRRAVVTQLAYYRWGAGTNESSFLWVHGIPVHHVEPGAAKAFYQAVRYTAYERETVKLAINGVDWSYSIDGYLFSDPDGRPDDADNIMGGFPLLGPLPSA
jgi:hypothetical protein